MDIDANVVIDKLAHQIAEQAKQIALLEAALENQEDQPIQD